MKRNMTFMLSVLSLASLFLLASCEKEKPGGDDGGSGDDGGKEAVVAPSSQTVGAEKVTPFSALLIGKADPGSPVDKEMVVGIIWSDMSDFPSSSTSKVKAEPDKNYNYSIEVNSLVPGKTYYFRSYLTSKGNDTLGETKEFKTKELSSIFESMDATDIKATSAQMNAKLDLEGVTYKKLEYGFYWGTSEESQEKFLKGSSIAEGKYSITLKDLQHKTQFWYKAYMKIDGQQFYGSLKTFTTETVSVESVSLDKTEYTFHTIGESISLKATVHPSDATDKGIKWTTSDEGIASVDDKGKVTAKSNGTATITVTAEENGKTASCSVTVSQYVTDITIDRENITLHKGESTSLSASVGPDNAADKSIEWTSSDESVATVDQSGNVKATGKGSAIISVTAKDGSGVSASCRASVYSYEVPDVVDLGLGVKWSTFNLGAASVEDPGMYFSWGETDTKDEFTWSTYSLCYGTNNSLNKYNVSSASGVVDGKTSLDREDDVSSKKLGGGFRIPTKEDFQELANPDNCTWTWTQINGVNGYKVTSKIEGYAGNWIFLPAAGHYEGNTLSKEGSVGFYWTDSIYTESPRYSNCLELSSGNYDMYISNRCEGLSVRPVTD